jgi:hypothetical protein
MEFLNGNLLNQMNQPVSFIPIHYVPFSTGVIDTLLNR